MRRGPGAPGDRGTGSASPRRAWRARLFGRAVPRSLGTALLTLLSGCAYFNGMYNANKFTRDAERSERAERPSEARERWVRAALHAESVTVRHPASRWADDAWLVRGRALLHLESWSDAVVALDRAARDAGDPEQRREALLLLGQANVALRRFEEAAPAFDAAAESGQRRRRDAALLARGRLRLLRGDPAGALVDFRASGAPGAALARAQASLALGQPDAAVAALDTLGRARAYREAEWLPLLDSLAQAGAGAGVTALVDTLVRRGGLRLGDQARVLLADGHRLEAQGRPQDAARRYALVRRLVSDSVEARAAEFRLARQALERAESDSGVAAARARLERVAQQGGTPAREAGPLVAAFGWMDRLAAEPAASPDAVWFLRAEVARDTLRAGLWAAGLFAAMPDRFPASPWTPKALIAAIALGHPDADALRRTLETRFADSPYAIVAAGGDSEAYGRLEDSLRVALVAVLGEPAGDAVAPGQPGAPRDVRREADDPLVAPGRPARPTPARPAATPQPRNPEPSP